MKLKMKDFLAITDLNKEELLFVLKNAKDFKSGKIKEKTLAGKSVAMIFEKPSTRTRLSFQTAIYELGGQPINLNSNEIQLSRGETVHDTAKVLSRYTHAITLRTFEHNRVVELAKHASVPVINALSDYEHPCQILADLQTMEERKGLKGIKAVFVGDGDNNVTNSYIFGCAILGIPLTVACPKEYAPKKEVLAAALTLAKKVDLTITDNPKKAVKNADVIYTDVWVSMGMEKEHETRKKAFKAFQLNEELMKNVKNKDYIVMHCLPAHRGDEITDAVIDGKHSVVFDEAENRKHAQKAILHLLIKNCL
ncbi:MAG: ornithine carbamoyltransferase [Candidatus Firestonebacteria bacterium]